MIACLAAVTGAAGCGRSPAPAPVSAAPGAAPAPQTPAAPGPSAPSPPVVPAAAPSAEEFLRRETEWAQMLANKNGAALEHLLAPEFLITGVGSTVADPVGGRGEWLQSVEKYPWPIHQVSDVRIAALGDTVVVKCVWSGVYPPDSLTTDGGALQLLVTDVWVRRGEDWVVLARHSSLPRKETP
jgi:hypothetical protein